MRVPRYWAEGRAHRPRLGRDAKQVTVRRWGWSDDSQAEAQRHADQRAKEALERVLAGALLPRREPKVAYNGAEGVPIREEIVARHGKTIVTRNSYGALCLNTPDVLFADIDLPGPPDGCVGCLAGLIAGLLATVACVALDAGRLSPLVIVGSAAGALLAFYAGVFASRRLRGGAPRIARRRVERFVAQNPSWGVRLYRTPAGFRVLAMHALFDPAGDEAAACFRALRSDPVYVRMCRKQACFRARVSPKPWRIGIERLRSRAVWPVTADRRQAREAWVVRYEAASKGHAACEFVEAIGSAMTHPDAIEVQRLHDELCRAESGRPIA